MGAQWRRYLLTIGRQEERGRVVRLLGLIRVDTSPSDAVLLVRCWSIGAPSGWRRAGRGTLTAGSLAPRKAGSPTSYLPRIVTLPSYATLFLQRFRVGSDVRNP